VKSFVLGTQVYCARTTDDPADLHDPCKCSFKISDPAPDAAFTLPSLKDLLKKLVSLPGILGCGQEVQGYASRSIKVVQVMNRISNIICPVHDFCFGASPPGAPSEQGDGPTEFVLLGVVGSPFTTPLATMGAQPGVFCHRRQRSAREVETWSPGSGCESCHYAERLRIPLESPQQTATSRNFPQLFLRDMSERRVPKVVGQGGSFDDIRINSSQLLRCSLWAGAELFGNPPGNLGNLKGVGQSIVEYVGVFRSDNLCDLGKTPERRAVQNPIPIALRVCSRVSRLPPFRAPSFVSEPRWGQVPLLRHAGSSPASRRAPFQES